MALSLPRHLFVVHVLVAAAHAVQRCLGIHAALLLDRLLQLHVGLFLNGLSVLQLFYQLHLKQLHLHHLLLLVRNQPLLLLNLALDVLARLLDLASAGLVNFLACDLLLNADRLLAVVVLVGELLHVLGEPHLVLLGVHLGFVGLLVAVHLNGGLDLLLFHVVLLANSLVVLRHLLLVVLVVLHTLDLVVHPLVVPLLQTHHLGRAFLGLLDLLPGAHLLLL